MLNMYRTIVFPFSPLCYHTFIIISLNGLYIDTIQNDSLGLFFII